MSLAAPVLTCGSPSRCGRPPDSGCPVLGTGLCLAARCQMDVAAPHKLGPFVPASKHVRALCDRALCAGGLPPLRRPGCELNVFMHGVGTSGLGDSYGKIWGNISSY